MEQSKQQLLRQAQDKELLAEKFDQYAKQLDKIFTDITPKSYGGDIWTGPAAERFQSDARRLDRELKRLAGNCRATSKNLRGAARALRSNAHKLKG